MDAYCLKCRTKREIRNPAQVTLKNGRRAAQGTCAVCGTKVYRIVKAWDFSTAIGDPNGGEGVAASSEEPNTGSKRTPFLNTM